MGNSATTRAISRISIDKMWAEMQSRLLKAIKDKDYELDGPSFRIKANVFHDAARFQAEKDLLFKQAPILAALSCEIPNPGDKLTFDLAGPPILIVRDKDRHIKAYLNLCPHRGARLVDNCTSSQMMTCPFHGWTFDLAGNLQSPRLKEAFNASEETPPQLVPVPAGEWEGMIFIQAAPGEQEIDVASFLGEFGNVLQALDMQNMTLVKQDQIDARSNWKFILDTFCESYHVQTLHKDTLARNLYSNISIKDHYGLHHRYSSPGLEFKAMAEGTKDSMANSIYTAVHYIFPNTTFAYSATVDGKNPALGMYRIFPGKTAGETIALATTYRPAYLPDDVNEDYRNIHDYVLNIVQSEDFMLSNKSWESIRHAPDDLYLTLRPQESILAHYHRDIASAIGMPLD